MMMMTCPFTYEKLVVAADLLGRRSTRKPVNLSECLRVVKSWSTVNGAESQRKPPDGLVHVVPWATLAPSRERWRRLSLLSRYLRLAGSTLRLLTSFFLPSRSRWLSAFLYVQLPVHSISWPWLYIPLHGYSLGAPEGTTAPGGVSSLSYQLWMLAICHGKHQSEEFLTLNSLRIWGDM